MKRLFFCFLVCSAGLLSPSQGQTQTPAFPGAEGFGAGATGGRGGPVYHVTSLTDSGAGSFRDAVSQPGRTIVFDIGGTIQLASELRVASDTTIAGQTAPGDGIAVYGQPVSLSNSRNIIVRHMRFRQGVDSNPHKSTIMLSASSQIIFDHCSIEWGRWDTVDMGAGSNLTLQNCIIGEGISPQRFGCLCQSDYVTFTHNLWISNHSRNPKAKGRVQYLDNILYNYGIGFVGGHSGADHFADVINNYFIKGPSSGNSFVGEFAATDKIFQSGNFADLDRNGLLDGRPVTDAEFKPATIIAQASLRPLFPATADSARDAYRQVASFVGASLVRDSVDSRLIRELMSLGKLGQVISDPATAGGPGRLNGGPAPKDSDGDGLPDYWELATGSNPRMADSSKPASNGGTLLEEYLNWLAAPHSVLNRNTPAEIDLRQYSAGFADAAPVYSVNQPVNGRVELLADGHTARFSPNAEFVGRAGFEFTVSGNDRTSMKVPIGLFAIDPAAAGNR